MKELSERQVEEVKRGLRPTWYATRRGRRTAAGMGVAALALLWTSPIVCWTVVPGDAARWVTLGLTAVALVIYAIVFAVLVAATDGAVTRDERRLDERQLAERRRIDALAHRVSGYVLGGAALFVGLLAATDEILAGPSAAAFTFLVAAWASHKIIPHLVACWHLPDAPGDE
ncbi:MAG: hypothetical protein DIU60_013330 [Actinomycetes bacterium]|jgi:hypothetical protein|nr:MAG: hypothetical protein DIU60_16285 [Actinomycetota bacterium]